MLKIPPSNLHKNINHTVGYLLMKLWQDISKRRKYQFLLLFFFMLFGALTEIMTIGMVVPFLGVLTNPDLVFSYPLVNEFVLKLNINSSEKLILPMTIMFILMATFSGIIRFFLLWLSTRLSMSTAVDLSVRIYKRTLHQNYETHLSRNSSEILSGITLKTGSVVSYIIFQCLGILTAMILSLSLLITMILIDPFIAIASFGGLGVSYIAISFIINNKLHKNGQYIADEQTKVVKQIQEGLGGIRDILIHGTQNVFVNLFLKSESKLRYSIGSNNILSSGPRFIIETLFIILFVILAYKVSFRPGGISEIIPILGAFALAAQKSLPLLSKAYHSWSKIIGNRPVLKDTLDLLNQPTKKNENKESVKPLQFNNEIQLSEVSFKYNENKNEVLKNISMTIKKGSRVGLIGGTGSGKSTLIDIIMGLLVPYKGQIYIDNTIIDLKNRKSWQRNIAHVPQSVFLSDSSFMENIAFGVDQSDIDLKRVKNVAKQAQIEDFISQLPNGFNSLVGERGARLSGGQCQRIGIARALYKNTSLLILDEATSALDTKTENTLMEIINNLDQNLTIIIIAHRVSTLNKCDIIYKIENGKIINQGNYENMIKNN
jgi:ATP-binding cassette, subfamily B, bacterial PglK